VVTDERTVGHYLRWLLTALALGAGVIHFAVSGTHFGLGWTHGTFLAALAWCQLLWAAAVALRPSRNLLVAGILLNGGVIAVWMMSRVSGVPVGPEAWTPEPVSLADALSSGFEAGIVVLSLAVLVRPTIARHEVRPALALPGVGSALVTVAAVSTVALTPSFASDHHGHGGDEITDHTHSDATVSNAGVASSPCKQSMPSGFEGPQVIGAGGGHAHHGPMPWRPIADRATRDELGRQLQIAHEATLRHPTVRDAEADGYEMITQYLPCIGAHYIKTPIFLGGFDPATPTMMLYDGTSPDSKVVGLSYAMLADKESPPEGFAGPSDLWHAHDVGTEFCVSNGIVINASGNDCTANGGAMFGFDKHWMNHTWVADGWPSSWGVFSSEHPDLGGRIGDINARPTSASRKAVAEYFTAPRSTGR
jgi:hypothetical protein